MEEPVGSSILISGPLRQQKGLILQMDLKPDWIGTRSRILAAVEGLNREQAESALVPGSWPVHGILEHLAQTAGKLERLQEHVATRASPIETPPKVVPSGRFGNWPGSLEAFLAARPKTVEMAQHVSAEHDRRVKEHPLLGNLTLRQWLWFAAAHSERHAAQIDHRLPAIHNGGLAS